MIYHRPEARFAATAEEVKEAIEALRGMLTPLPLLWVEDILHNPILGCCEET